MEDNAPEPVLVENLNKLAADADALDAILTARSIEAGNQRFKAGALAFGIGAHAIKLAVRAVAAVAEKPEEGARRGDWLCTHTGKKFYPLDPKAEECSAEDIALSLCQKVRWSGLMVGAFTVGEHSIRVGRVARVLAVSAGLSPHLCEMAEEYGRFHDAAEAYLPDIPRPLKAAMPEWRSYEQAVQLAIEEYLGLPPMPTELDPIVHQADRILLILEAETGFTRFDPHGFHGWALPRIGDLGLTPPAMVAVVKVAAMAETWPRSQVNAWLLASMGKLLEAKARREAVANEKADARALVPHSGLRPADPNEADARYQKIAADMGADTAPVDLEEQLRRAEMSSGKHQSNGG